MLKFQMPACYMTTNKTIRTPVKVSQAVEAAIRGKRCTYSDFVVKALRWALNEVAEAKAKFPVMDKGAPTVNKTIRIPDDVVAGINSAIVGTKYTFSSFTVCAVRLALEALKNQQAESCEPSER